MCSMDSSHPASAVETTDASSLVRPADLAQASWRRAVEHQAQWSPSPPLELRGCSAIESNCGFESAIGNLKIAEVHPGGHFVKILNCASEKEESIGEHLLMQNVQGQPVAVFRFPPKIRMAAGSVVTVWAADAKVPHKPPSDFLWKDLERFGTGLNCATILCEPSGQAVAWYTPLHGNRRQGWVVREERENLENIAKPSSSRAKQKEGWEKEQETTITDTEWKQADPGQKGKKRQSFIKRPLTMGNDGSSLCRQSRCQSARPDPEPGEKLGTEKELALASSRVKVASGVAST
nr:PREDICTED: lamin tail domain-containing protein 1 [Struthio camelus australis]